MIWRVVVKVRGTVWRSSVLGSETIEKVVDFVLEDFPEDREII